MRLELPAIEVTQNKSSRVYLTKLNVGQIKGLIESKQIVPDTYNPDISAERGYQRALTLNRVKKITRFLNSNYKIVLSVMPTSIVLSARKRNIEPLAFKDGKLIVGDDATLYVVDGQHRVWSIKDHKNPNYEVPITLIYGLDEHQEAAQFLVINSTQKRVDPSLQTRVLFHADKNLMDNLISEIKSIIPWQGWKLEALELAIGLENDPDNPWYMRVKVPNDSSNESKPIKEGSFVDSFRSMTSDNSPIHLIALDKKAGYLKDYWNIIRKLWSKAFEEDHLSDYILVAPFGAGVFNTLFPSILTLKNVTGMSFEKLLTPISKSYPVNRFSRVRGELQRRGNSQKVFKNTAEEFVLNSFPRLDYRNITEYEKIREKTHNLRWIADKAYDMLSPLLLRPAEHLKSDKGKYRKACYVLVNLKEDDGEVSVYVGQSKSIEQRLSTHNKKYNLYSVDRCDKDEEMNQLEGALWHLVKKSVRDNSVHPNKKFCPFC